MAVTSTISYCSDTNLLEVYPSLSGYDLKRRIYGWELSGSNKYFARNSGEVTQLYADGKDLGAAQSSYGDVGTNEEWFYDDTADTIWYVDTATNPTDKVMEAGFDWETLKTTFRKRASRMVESMLDSRISREIMKDREGNYPEFIIRATALKAITLLMKAHDPENPVIESFEEEFKEIIEGYRSGNIQLPNAVTADSSKGVIRTVSVNASSDLFPVELRGNYNASGFDNIQVKVIQGGIMGTATYSVWVKDNDKLKTHQVITAEKITGDFDLIAFGISLRWAGDDSETAVCTADDEYEIEVHSSGMSASVSHVGTVTLSRVRG